MSKRYFNRIYRINLAISGGISRLDIDTLSVNIDTNTFGFQWDTGLRDNDLRPVASLVLYETKKDTKYISFLEIKEINETMKCSIYLHQSN